MRKEQIAALQELCELGYHAVADELQQGIERWDDSLKRRRPVLIKRYLKGQDGFHVHVRVIDGAEVHKRVSCEYCLWLQYAGRDFEIDDVRQEDACFVCVYDVPPDMAIWVSGGWHGDTRGQRPMLIDPVQFMDLPEGVVPIGVPTKMRLQCVNDCLWRIGDAPDFLPFFIGSHGAVEEDRKLGALFLGGGHPPLVNSSDVDLSERECDVVEGVSEIVETVANQQAEGFRHGVDAGDAEPSMLTARVFRLLRQRLLVWFINEAVGLRLDPGYGVVAKLIEVAPCPLEL